jgi:tartrate dehydratase alpha subunit/fumarate hydratase class I-like protein
MSINRDPVLIDLALQGGGSHAAFLTMLKEEGRGAVEKFLKHHVNDFGQRSTVNLDVLLQQV